jgi:hypothetical protein
MQDGVARLMVVDGVLAGTVVALIAPPSVDPPLGHRLAAAVWACRRTASGA